MLIWELARKDLRLFLADWRGVVLCFAIPILLASAFGAIFHRPAGAEAYRLRASEDNSPFTQRVVAALCASEQLDARIRSLAEAEGDQTGVVFVLPAGFGEMTRGSRPEVRILHQPGHGLEARLAEGLLTEIALREAARELLGRAAERPFVVRAQALRGPSEATVNTYAHSFCGMSLQYLLFWGMDSGLLLLRERRRGIWRRLRSAPVGLGTLLAGKALATALVALAQIAVTFAFAWLVFGVTIDGSLPGFVVLAIAAALLSAATGLVVAAVGGNENRARSVAILTILTASMLGGLWLPAFLLPAWVQNVALLLPITWAARGLEGVTWQGLGWAGAWPCALVVLGYSAAFLLLALWCFSRAESRSLAQGGAP
jgi:ABC-2 type transport system permease protein